MVQVGSQTTIGENMCTVTGLFQVYSVIQSGLRKFCDISVLKVLRMFAKIFY